MSRLLPLAALFILVASPALGEEKAAQPPALVEKLHTYKVSYEGDINNVSLFDLLQTFSRKYDITFLINEEAFKDAGENAIRERKSQLTATRLDGLSLSRFLDWYLNSMGATFLVRQDYLEIVPLVTAAREAKLPMKLDQRNRLSIPLTSANFQARPLHAAVEDLANWYETTIVISPRVGDAKSLPVTTRLLNVPLDKSLAMLALQADLVVIPVGNAYLITTEEHAAKLSRNVISNHRPAK